MTACVVDTNVILVANGHHAGVSPECVKACVERLNELMKSGVLVVDDGFRILSEYLNKTNPRAAKGVGDVFVKWALRHRGQAHRVQEVALTEQGRHQYKEFPDAALQARFDKSDRMFAAVAHAHSGHPAIWQATDCKWLDWWPALKACGVEVEFLCAADVCRFYAGTFPNKPMPPLP
jgi:hypothetical protein